ncbi:hypothetical protein PGB90_005237 [Kerria lacca]
MRHYSPPPNFSSGVIYENVNFATYRPNKYKELKGLNKYENDDNIIIKSPILNDPNTNPCIKEQNLSAKCMIDNNYDKAKCVNAFENYKICNKFWKFIKFKRRMEGIQPVLPPPEERYSIITKEFDQIQQFKKKMKKSST